MAIGSLFVIAAAVGFAVLVLLVARKMMRGGLSSGSVAGAIEPGASDDDDALAREALGEARPSAPAPGDDTSARTSEPAPSRGSAPADAPESTQAAFTRGLEKTRGGFMARLNGLLFGGRALDPSLVDELEELLVTSDIGIKTATRLLGDLREQLSKKALQDPEAVRSALRQRVLDIVRMPCPPLGLDQPPRVIMVIGVNGVGKTTTIGKLAARLHGEGKKVVLAAGDTFRAAAVEQLGIWAERSGAELVKGPDNGDPASVAFDAVSTAKRVGADVCIADTAGRLHTKVNLMEELKKVKRVMDKALPGAPHEVILVLDATTGQNAITQAEQFTSAVQVNSVVLTKLDGTAKGGVVVAICDALRVPVRYIGVGERVEDLRDFDAEAFVDALFAR